MSTHPSPKPFGPVINRISCAASHVPEYYFRGIVRFAEDAQVHPSSVSRLVHGQINPSFVLVARLTTALEKRLGKRIDPRDLVAENGQFLTTYVCDLVKCPGCLPENALDEFGSTKEAYKGVEVGKWVTSRYPRGYDLGKEGHVRK